MRILFVNSCIREDSRTLFLCRKYIEKNYKNDEVREIETEKESISPFNSEMLRERENDIRKGDFSSEKYRLAREFSEADEIVIGAPYWDCSFPSSLKVFIEHICVNGLTFAYEKGLAKKLCRAKKLVYITTAGGYLPQNSSVKAFFRELCSLLSVDNMEFYAAEGLDIYGNDVNKILFDSINEF